MKKNVFLTSAVALSIATSSLVFASPDGETSANLKAPAVNVTTTVRVSPDSAKNAAGNLEYVVQKNDNLTKIAKKYGTTWQEIAKLNALKNPNLIYPGDVLLIPGQFKDAPQVEKPTETAIPLVPLTPAKPVDEKPAIQPDPMPPTEQVAKPDPMPPTEQVAKPDPMPPTETPAVTEAPKKESSEPEEILKGLSADGYWNFAILSDVTLSDELVVEGDFYSEDDSDAALYRELALYSQDEDQNITAEYILTVPAGMRIKSPNFRIENGTVVGDVYVDVDGFELYDATIDGNVYFVNESARDTAKLDAGTREASKVTGTINVVEDVNID